MVHIIFILIQPSGDTGSCPVWKHLHSGFSSHSFKLFALVGHSWCTVCTTTISSDTVYPYKPAMQTNTSHRYLLIWNVNCWWPTWQRSFIFLPAGPKCSRLNQESFQFSLLSHTFKSTAMLSNAIKCLCSGKSPLDSLQHNQLCINE